MGFHRTFVRWPPAYTAAKSASCVLITQFKKCVTSSSDSEEEIFILSSILDNNNKKIKRRMWVHPINAKRQEFGEFYHLFDDLKSDEQKFFQYFRMTPVKFAELLNLLKSKLTLQNSHFRRAIPKEERLAVTLRFLATGDTFRTIGFSYRLGESTVRKIVYNTCEAIWEILMPLVMPPPTKETWKQNEEDFLKLWNFPNCIAAIDGKHVVTDKPPNSGSLFFNYKKTFSIVLLAFVDANYRFTAIDVGAYGKNSDEGIFTNSVIGKRLFKNDLDLPGDKCLPGTNTLLPHVMVGDEAFPLHRHIMRPYPNTELTKSDEFKVYNYRLSRARRVSENAFGILTKRFRIYQRRLQIIPEHMDTIVMATCCLHNFLRNDVCHWTEGEEESAQPEGIEDIPGIGGSSTTIAMDVRNKFKDYFNSEKGSVPWQAETIKRGKRKD